MSPYSSPHTFAASLSSAASKSSSRSVSTALVATISSLRCVRRMCCATAACRASRLAAARLCQARVSGSGRVWPVEQKVLHGLKSSRSQCNVAIKQGGKSSRVEAYDNAISHRVSAYLLRSGGQSKKSQNFTLIDCREKIAILSEHQSQLECCLVT